MISLPSKKCPVFSCKHNNLTLYRTFLKQIEKGMSKIKNETEEFLNAITKEVNAIDNVLLSIEDL